MRFLDDGTLELDTNPVENQIRPITLTRKNALFAGNEVGAENWAMLASLVATCKMSGVTPVDYLVETLRRPRRAPQILHRTPHALAAPTAVESGCTGHVIALTCERDDGHTGGRARGAGPGQRA
nr:transposase [Aureimonas populi]